VAASPGMSDPTETSPRLCAWCGKGPVPPSRGTKPRAYCSRSCVQRAHEARKERERTKDRLVAAYMKGRREEAELSAAKSRDFPPATSRDFPEAQVTPPGAELCPYCRAPVVGLVGHLRQCPEGPGTAGEPDGRPRRDPHG
jgi:hypothetical protein